MTAIDDLQTFARSFRRMTRYWAGNRHRARLIMTRQYIKTSSRKARP